MGYQINQDGVIIRESKDENTPSSNGKMKTWPAVLGFVVVIVLIIVALLPKRDSLDNLYKMNVPKGFRMEYNNGYSQRNYQDGNGGGIGVYYEGGGWGESVDDYLREKELDISLYTPLQINWMEARSIKEETVDFLYNSFVIISDHGIFVIKFDYPIGRKSYYEGLMDEVVYSFKQK